MTAFGTYFVRHTANMDLDQADQKRFWDEGKIIVHFPWDLQNQGGPNDSTSIDPKDYEKSAARSIRVLVELAKNGGFVCAEHHLFRNHCLIGFVPKDSTVELGRSKWGNRYGESMAGRTAIVKMLQLTRTKRIPIDQCNVLLAARPRQGTISRWPNIGAKVRDRVEGIVSPRTLSDLSPAQQEVLCAELLRLPEAKQLGLPTLACLLLPTGRTLKALDLVGLADDGKAINAQVSYCQRESSEFARKLEALKVHGSNDDHLLFFCACEKPDKRDDGVLVFPIKTVFDSFQVSKLGNDWLARSM